MSTGHDIIVIGASAGGLEALMKLSWDLPQDLPAALFIVIHIPAHSKSLLPNILNRSLKKRCQQTSWQAVHPDDGEVIQHGRIYVAPPNRHLLVKKGSIRLAHGPKENSHRPAVDPLFRTAARSYKRRVVGIVLSGTLDDGTAGLAAVKQLGGVAIVQDPEDALYSGMPQSAMKNVSVDYVLPASDIPPLLAQLAYEPVEEAAEAVSSEMEMESDMAELELTAMQSLARPGTPSPFACPDCSGVLWEINEGKLSRFRCRTGHAYSTQSLLVAQTENMEEALWSALRALEEKSALSQKMAERARDSKRTLSAKRFQEQRDDCQRRAALIRKLLLNGDGNGQPGNTEKGELGDLTDWVAIAPSPFPVVAIALWALRFAIAASAGGVEALVQVLSDLPLDFTAAIVVVQHLSRQHPSQTTEILSRHTQLAVKQAEAGDLLQPGKVYIAPPNQHLLVVDQTISLSQSQLVHFVRPSADLLFESVAASFKERAIAVVLTGMGKDGAMGVEAIKEMGGTAIAQDRDTSEYFAMPEAAINTGCVDRVVPLEDIAATLVSLVSVKDK